eukprot:TRINITY_DN12045_c0_g1_i1.p1 TRINITY_DN12045_c0_g1~~TRINITY_DN12045_c0_g1_i1.p1  ORF type:complete len:245 (+),score=47.51 TRINITY_DN12045_c0_g1_i1:31-735(+)
MEESSVPLSKLYGIERQDTSFNVIMLGDSGVGKTNLATRFAKNDFDVQSPATAGADTMCKSILVDGVSVTAVVWDTAGQERFRAITKSYYRKAAAAVVVYDVTREQSFANASDWLDDIFAATGSETRTVCALVGNKSDLKAQRQVSASRGRALAAQYGATFDETSALDSSNVDRVFRTLIAAAYRQRLATSSSMAGDLVDSVGSPRSALSAGNVTVFPVSAPLAAGKKRACCNI